MDTFLNILLALLPLIIFSFFFLYRIIRRTRREIEEFSEAVETGDLTRKYNEENVNLKQVHKSLNRISASIRKLNNQRESQQQYLRKVLELVDTGILAYNIETQEVLIINEALGNTLNIPLIKNMAWLQKHNEELYHHITNIPLGKKELISFKQAGLNTKMLTSASLFETEEENYKVIAFHNVKSVMEEVEANAWKGLLDVMTHEIMNSVTPVSSLTETLKKQIDLLKEEKNLENEPTVEDIESALEAIQRRSDGLLRFSETYRSLSRKITPDLQEVNLYQLIGSIAQLMEPSMLQKTISLEVKSNDTTVVSHLDRSLIEQAIINFITNAAYALSERPDPVIAIYTGIKDDHPYITVADNGHGIPDEIREKIFVPFFSTRKKGSGIGLSLSREIIKLHQATLHVQSKEGEGSAFTIVFSRS